MKPVKISVTRPTTSDRLRRHVFGKMDQKEFTQSYSANLSRALFWAALWSEILQGTRRAEDARKDLQLSRAEAESLRFRFIATPALPSANGNDCTLVLGFTFIVEIRFDNGAWWVIDIDQAGPEEFFEAQNGRIHATPEQRVLLVERLAHRLGAPAAEVELYSAAVLLGNLV